MERSSLLPVAEASFCVARLLSSDCSLIPRVNGYHLDEQSQCCASVNAFKFGGIPFDKAQASMRLFAKEVMPELHKLGNEPLFDTEEATPPAFMAA